MRDGAVYRDYRFESMKSLEQRGLTPCRENYSHVYSGNMRAENSDIALEAIYTQLNIHHPADYSAHSVSVSDIIVLNDGERDIAYYVDNIGFRELSRFENEADALSVLAADIARFHKTQDGMRIHPNDIREALELGKSSAIREALYGYIGLENMGNASSNTAVSLINRIGALSRQTPESSRNIDASTPSR